MALALEIEFLSGVCFAAIGPDSDVPDWARSDLDTEMTVVRNEFERWENNPRLVLWGRMQSVAYDWHNYGNLAIGARSDIENVKGARVACLITSIKARSGASGAPVSTNGQPATLKPSSSAAVCSAGQHLNIYRDPGWMTRKRPRGSQCAASNASTRAFAASPGTSTSFLSASSGQKPMRRNASRFVSTVCRNVPRGSRKRCENDVRHHQPPSFRATP